MTISRISAVATIVIMALATGFPSQGTAGGDADEHGYVSLFNGEDLDGWVIENNGQFSVRDGLLVLDKGTGWLRSAEQYADFVLKMDFRFLDKKANMVKYVKNQNSEPLDKEVKIGKPMDEKWLKAHTTIFHSLVGTPFRSDAEYVEYVQRVHTLRTKYGYVPEE